LPVNTQCNVVINIVLQIQITQVKRSRNNGHKHAIKLC